MSVERKRIVVVGHQVEIRLYDKAEEVFIARTFQEGEHGELFVIEFMGTVTDEMVVHECWHCFFRILARSDMHEHVFRELIDEIYAYSFSDFFSSVKSIVQNMRLYKRIYEQKGKD